MHESGLATGSGVKAMVATLVLPTQVRTSGPTDSRPCWHEKVHVSWSVMPEHEAPQAIECCTLSK